MSGRVIRVSGGFSGPEFEVTRHDGGWMVILAAAPPDKPEVVVRAARSYERAAIAIERRLLANTRYCDMGNAPVGEFGREGCRIGAKRSAEKARMRRETR
jgi:hypothetical protein